MGITGKKHRVWYVAKDHTQFLSDVKLIVIRPDTIQEGPFLMGEYTPPTSATKGHYFYDYLPTLEGEYLFIVDSATIPKRFSQAVTFNKAPDSRPVMRFD